MLAPERKLEAQWITAQRTGWRQISQRLLVRTAVCCDLRRKRFYPLAAKEDGRDKLEPIRHEFPLTIVRFSPSGERFAVGGQAGAFWIHDARMGTTLVSRQAHQANIIYLSFSPDGKELVTTSQDATAQVWDSQTGQPIGEESIMIAAF